MSSAKGYIRVLDAKGQLRGIRKELANSRTWSYCLSMWSQEEPTQRHNAIRGSHFLRSCLYAATSYQRDCLEHIYTRFFLQIVYCYGCNGPQITVNWVNCRPKKNFSHQPKSVLKPRHQITVRILIHTLHDVKSK